MTSLAMIIGLLPMMFASGVGKNGNQTLGAAAVGGMLLGTLFQVIIVPGLFVIFQSLQEKISPLKFDDEENDEVATEIGQYMHRPVDYELEK
jgi:HAE1 family hydrophobic/amphiphilic exporter-1